MSIIEALPADVVAAAPSHGPATGWRVRRHLPQGTALPPLHPVA